MPGVDRLEYRVMSPVFRTIVALSLGPLAVASAPAPVQTGHVRIATFNCSLNRNADGELVRSLAGGMDPQARNVARVLRTVRPDIVLLNEFDYDERGVAIDLFRMHYLEASADWAPEPPLVYEHSFSGPVNTGVPSGRDLDHDGKTDGPGDAIGFGRFPGQYGLVILSRFPLAADQARTFQKLLWKDMPDSVIPAATTAGAEPWYSADDLAVLRLSSKSHIDVPVVIGTHTIHLLASHPTPPAFDGPEDRNGRRNHDEIRLWAEYLSSGDKPWLVDDAGRPGTLAANASFVLLGDQNADPVDGGSYQNAIRMLLDHPRVNSSFAPASEGGPEVARQQGQMNASHRGDPAHDTSDFNDASVGNLRVDYALPSRDLTVVASGIFWPTPGAPGSEFVDCSDHRLVWIDVDVAN